MDTAGVPPGRHGGRGPLFLGGVPARGARGGLGARGRSGASSARGAEGPGHNRDTQLVLEESGLGEVLIEDRIPFVDLNYDEGYTIPNAGRWTEIGRASCRERG